MADLQGSFILFFISLISIVLIRAFFAYNRNKSRNPPTPFALPIIGHLHLLAPIPHQAFHKLSIRYGPIFRIFLGSVPCVVTCSPEIAKEFLKTNESSFSNRPNNMTVDYLTYGSKDFIFTPYGPHWKFMKKIVMLELLNGKTLNLLYPIRRDETNLFLKSLFEKAKSGKWVNLDAELVKMSNNVISRMITSKRSSEDDGETRKLVADLAEVAGGFNLTDFIWFFKYLNLNGLKNKVKDVRKRFDHLADKIIKEHEDARKQRKEKGDVHDLLDILLNISKDESMEIELTKENIKGLIMNMFVAGTDTSALTLQWALAELINHPNIMKKAVEEIDQVVGKNRLLQESDIPNLPYLQSVVKETLRLHPTTPLIGRMSTKECVVGGYHIPERTALYVNIWALGRDPAHWKNPLEFSPERYEKGQVDMRGQHFHMLPFGTGKRMCPGISLALYAVQTTLGAMIQCFEWRAGEEGNLARVDMEEGHGITLSRANPLVCVPLARLHSMPSSI